MWYVTVDKYCYDPKAEDHVWTVSRNPKETGWVTDGGYEGYGLTKIDAEELANAANTIERLREVLKRIPDELNDGNTIDVLMMIDTALKESE